MRARSYVIRGVALARLGECLLHANNFFPFKFTVQFETEGNGQNDTFSPMDRSEVKL